MTCDVYFIEDELRDATSKPAGELSHGDTFLEPDPTLNGEGQLHQGGPSR